MKLATIGICSDAQERGENVGAEEGELEGVYEGLSVDWVGVSVGKIVGAKVGG